MLFFVRLSLIFLAVILDATFFGRPGDSWVFPGATLLLAMSWTLILGFSESIGWVLLSGIVADIFLFAPLGFFTLVFAIAAYGTENISRRLRSGNVFRLPIVFGGALLFSLIAKGLFVWFSLETQEMKNFFFSGMRETGIWRMLIFFLGLFLFFLGYVCLRRLENFFSFYGKRIRPMGRYVK